MQNAKIENGKDKAAMAVILPILVIILIFMWF